MADIEAFIERWKKSGAAERSNFQPFMQELCDLLGVPRPDPATPNEDENNYVFERRVTPPYEEGETSSYNWIDLYRRGSFVMEGKQSRKRLEDPRRKVLFQLGLDLSSASRRTEHKLAEIESPRNRMAAPPVNPK